MAKITNYDVIGKLEYITYALAWCKCGTVLENYGQGWKIRCKLSSGDAAIRHYGASWALNDAWEESHPYYAQYKRLLHKTVCRKYWHMVHNAVIMSGDDSDGLWSDLVDTWYMRNITPGDCQALCKAYQLYKIEREENPPQGINVRATK